MWKVGGTEKRTSNFCTQYSSSLTHIDSVFIFYFTNSQGKFVIPNTRESGRHHEFQILHTKGRGNLAKFRILTTLRIIILTISNAWSPFTNIILSSLLFHQSIEFFFQGAIGFEIWTVTSGQMMDNIIITYDKQIADEFAEHTWKVKHEEENRLEEEERKKVCTLLMSFITFNESTFELISFYSIRSLDFSSPFKSFSKPLVNG